MAKGFKDFLHKHAKDYGDIFIVVEKIAKKYQFKDRYQSDVDGQDAYHIFYRKELITDVVTAYDIYNTICNELRKELSPFTGQVHKSTQHYVEFDMSSKKSFFKVVISFDKEAPDRFSVTIGVYDGSAVAF